MEVLIPLHTLDVFLSRENLEAADLLIPNADWTEHFQRPTDQRLAENFYYQKELNFSRRIKTLQPLASTYTYVMTFMQGLVVHCKPQVNSSCF